MVSFFAVLLFLVPQQSDAARYNRQGISFHMGREFKAAETAYKNALKLQPDYADAINNLAVLYYSQRKFSDAEREIRRAVEKNPESPVIRLNLRAARYARENTRSSREVANEVAKQNPLLIEKQDGDLLQMQILMPAKDLEEATLHERRGDSYFARKLYDDAIAEYQKSIAIDRYNASTLNRLGLVYHQSQRMTDAERYYREALKQNPYFLEVLNNIGTVEYARQRYDSAISQYQKALKIRPDSPTVLLNMGFCLFEMKRYDEGNKAIQQALQLDPKILEKASGFGTLIQTSRRGDPAVSFYFARIYAAQGEKERSISYLNRALDEGFMEVEKIKTDPIFKILADEEGYMKVLDRIASPTTSSNQDK
ncbi:MAG TPA: tetratricopeptide repeat protein [Terriglobia bacterium]|nr:tetratricopeptide repeat protein [Terriglobia bacterium]